jgi:hypothetical protein
MMHGGRWSFTIRYNLLLDFVGKYGILVVPSGIVPARRRAPREGEPDIPIIKTYGEYHGKAINRNN